MRMKNVIFYIATVCAWAVFQPASAQNADKERLKSNLERAFAPAPAAPIPAQNTPRSPDPDKTLFYVQILASVRPLEDTGDKALRVFPDLKHYREDRYLKYYTGPGTDDYAQAQAQLRAVQAKGYPEAFVIALRSGQKIPLKEAIASSQKK